MMEAPSIMEPPSSGASIYLRREKQAMGKASSSLFSLYIDLTKIGKYGKRCLARASLAPGIYPTDSLASLL